MGPITAFMLVPSMAAVLTGWIARHWSLAAAAVMGGMGLFLLLAPMGSFFALVLLPAASGIAVAGLVLIPVLHRRPSVSIWSRMSLALGATFITHFIYLTYAMAGQ